MKHKNEIIIGTLAVLSIILVAIESIVTVSQSVLIGLYIADLLICVVFAIDFIRRLRNADKKKQFMKTNGYEILAVVPAIALYALGTIPAIALMLRSLRLVRVLRVILMLARMKRVASALSRFVLKSHLLTLMGITIFIIFVGAFAALVLDSGLEGAKITNMSDAVWWSISTVTTVGYGDIVPSSAPARIMGMILMVVGIGVMAAFISQVSATLVESRINRKPKQSDFVMSIIEQIKSKLDHIDELSDSDIVLVTQMIQTLRGERKGSGENE